MHRLSIQLTNMEAASVENYGVSMKLTHQELLTTIICNLCRYISLMQVTKAPLPRCYNYVNLSC